MNFNFLFLFYLYAHNVATDIDIQIHWILLDLSIKRHAICAHVAHVEKANLKMDYKICVGLTKQNPQFKGVWSRFLSNFILLLLLFTML